MQADLNKAAAAAEEEAQKEYQDAVKAKMNDIWNDLTGGFNSVCSLLNLVVEEIAGQGFLGGIGQMLGGGLGMLQGGLTIGGGLLNLLGALGPLLGLGGGAAVLGTTAIAPILAATAIAAFGGPAAFTAALMAASVATPFVASTVVPLTAATAPAAALALAPLLMLQEGGIVHKPTVAMIGENGPEAVVPLNRSIAPINVIIHGDVYSDSMVNKIENAVSNAVQKRYRQMGVRA
jgi:hypothetical protein